ncbi:MAG: protein kinase [Deltaproteobacteria bacterium]|nr:protein kinase [Deltaproteobacteria bacterium]
MSFAGSTRFRLLETLGAGAFGAVYRAEDRERETIVALKTLHEVEAESLLYFKNEFRALQDLDHPNVVHFHELHEVDGEWFFTMDLVEGTDFQRHVRPEGRLEPERLNDAVRQVATALATLHRAGLVHRDVKPSNVRVDESGRAVLLDFGLVTPSRAVQQDMVGTPSFMAPEQARQAPVGPPADVYALGVMLFQAWTGELPFDGNALHLVVRKQMVDAPSLGQVDPDAPRELIALCDGMLQREPEARPSAEQVSTAFANGLLDGVAPSPPLELRATVTPQSDEDDATLDAIPTHDTPISARAVAQVRAAAAEAPPEALFVGRETELAILDRALRKAREGAFAAVFVEGESGVGKSALVQAFRAGVERADGLVLAGRCYEHERVPYKAFDGIVDALSRRLRRRKDRDVEKLLTPEGTLLDRVFPVLGQVPAIAVGGGFRAPKDGLELRDLCFRALADLLDALADEGPLLLTVDDFQWADADSLRLFEVLAEHSRVLLVATLREPTREIAELASSWERLPLERLGPREAQALAEAMAPEGVDPATLAEKAEGHPLFIAELAQHLERQSDGPVDLRAAIRARIEALDREERDLVFGAAIAARPMPPSVSARAAEVPVAHLSRRLKALRLASLVRTSPDAEDPRLECFHDHVRSAALSLLDDSTRSSWHRRLASAIESRAQTTDAEALALHWREAGEIDRGADHALVAARSAARALAFDRAADFFVQALERERAWDAQQPIHVELADALRQAGRGAEAAEHYVTATRETDPVEGRRLRSLATQTYLQSGQLDAGLELAEGLLREMGMSLPKGPKRALASLLWNRARNAMRGLAFDAKDEADVEAPVLEKVDTLGTMGTALAMADFIRGADFQARAVRLALDSGERKRVARALASEGATLSTSEAPPMKKGRALLERAEALADDIGDPETSAWVDLSWGTAHLNQFEFAPALERARRADEIFRAECTGVPWELSTTHTIVTMSLWSMGRYRELASVAPQVLREARERSDVYGSTTITTSGAYAMYIAEDRAEEGVDRVAAAMREWGQPPFQLQHFLEMEAMTELEVYLGGRAAYERLQKGWPDLRRSLLLTVRSVKFIMLACRARAALCLAKDDASERERLVRAAAKDVKAARPLLDNAACQGQLDHVEGSVLAASGQTDAAIAKLREAEQRLRDGAMEGYAHAAALRRAVLEQDDDGTQRATDALRGCGVLNPRRYAWLRSPGPWE